MGQLTTSGGKEGQVTYRVLQCSELDLTSTLSSLSDGWKFEQVTALKNEEVKNEFLLVLSRRSPQSSQINLDQGNKVDQLHHLFNSNFQIPQPP